jgi:hypothetical protein
MRLTRLLAILALALGLMAITASTAMAGGRDSNNDRIPDRWEKNHGLSTHVKQTNRDQDRDGLKNLGEFRAKTDPRDDDSDNDGTEDGDEDRDHDRVDNANEVREHTSPTDKDSDDDGKSDAREDADHDDLNNAGEDKTGNDPLDKDTDNDGTEDGEENAGTVASFDAATGALVINLSGGGTVSGKVDGSTEISCNTEDEDENENDNDDADESRVRASHEGDDDGDRKGSNGREGSNHGDNELDDDDEVGDEDNKCSAADLKAGTVVHEADLKGSGASATFEEIELVK